MFQRMAYEDCLGQLPSLSPFTKVLEGLESGRRRVRGGLRRPARITGDRPLEWGREQASSPPATRFNDNNIEAQVYTGGVCAVASELTGHFSV